MRKLLLNCPILVMVKTLPIFHLRRKGGVNGNGNRAVNLLRVIHLQLTIDTYDFHNRIMQLCLLTAVMATVLGEGKGEDELSQTDENITDVDQNTDNLNVLESGR